MKKIITYIGVAFLALYLYLSVIKPSIDAVRESVEFIKKQHKQAENINMLTKDAIIERLDDDSEDKKRQDISHLVRF